VNSIFSIIWKIIKWAIALYIIFIGSILTWIYITSDEESVTLSIKTNDKDKKLAVALREINYFLEVPIEHQMEACNRVKSIKQKEYIDCNSETINIDSNETTVEILILNRELNASIKSYHEFWILQSKLGEENQTKILLQDNNVTFPIKIKNRNSKKWSIIEAETGDGKIKKWHYKNRRYIE
jgi:hypothetical protein